MCNTASSVALLLPGMSLNASIFPDLGMPAIAPDLSHIDLGTDGVTTELRADGFAVYQRLLDESLESSHAWEETRRIVVGHSFGGMLALRWLLDSRSTGLAEINGLVLIATTAGPMYERVRPRLRIPWGLGLRVPVSWIVPIWNRPLVIRAVKRFLCDGQLGADRVDFRTADIQSDRDMVLAGWRNSDWRAVRAYRFSMRGFDVRQRLGEITAPTIVLHGTHDSLFGVEEGMSLSTLLPNAELRLVEGAGHSLPVLHGGAVAQAVTDVLRA